MSWLYFSDWQLSGGRGMTKNSPRGRRVKGTARNAGLEYKLRGTTPSCPRHYGFPKGGGEDSRSPSLGRLSSEDTLLGQNSVKTAGSMHTTEVLSWGRDGCGRRKKESRAEGRMENLWRGWRKGLPTSFFFFLAKSNKSAEIQLDFDLNNTPHSLFLINRTNRIRPHDRLQKHLPELPHLDLLQHQHVLPRPPPVPLRLVHRRLLVLPKVDDRRASRQTLGDDVDAVPFALEELRVRDVRDGEGVVERGTGEAVFRFVGFGEEDEVRGEGVAEGRGGGGEREGGVVGDGGGLEELGVDILGEESRVGEVQRL